MTEQEKIDQFNRDVEGVLKGNAPEAGTDPQRLDAARQLAAADFSANSHARATTRARLLARANRELPVQNKRKEMNTKFSGLFRTLVFGAFLLMIVFGLGWVLSNTTPQVGVGLEGTATSEPVIVPEEPAIAFPRKGATEDLMESLMMGRLILVDRCLRIEDSESDTSLLVVWPYDFNWQITNGIVEVLDGTGQVVARVGEGVSMGGGELDSLAGMGIDNPIQAQIPDSCPGPYWFVGSGVQMTELDNQVFRSEANHLEVTVPDGWAAYEGEEYLASPFTGVVAFNSWGEQGFWAPEVVTQQSDEVTTYSYGVEDVLPQIPQDGVYIVLVWQSGGPPPEEGSFVEYVENDLSGLWRPLDCRRSGGRYLDFYKFERILRLEIYCGPQASDTTVEAANSLLSSWQFVDERFEQLKQLADLWDASLLESKPIWVHLVHSGHLLQFPETYENDPIPKPNPNIMEYYYYVDNDLRILKAVTFLKDKDEHVVETKVLQDETWFNLTLGTSEGVTTQVHFRSFGSQFVSRVENFLANGGSLEVQEITDESGRLYLVFTATLETQIYEATFDPSTGQLTNLNIFQLGDGGEKVLESKESSLEESFSEPPAEILDLLEQTSNDQSPTPLTLDSDSETIRQYLLDSASRWQSLWADALVTTESKGEKHTERQQVWINLPDQSRWLSGLEGTQPSLLQITSGADMVLITAEGDRFESTTTRPQIADLETVIFPSDLARGVGTFEVVREETVADRPALVVEWHNPEDRVEHRLWLDTETGIILRWQNLFPEPPDGSGKTEPSEIQIVKITYNPSFSDELFSLNQALDLEFTEGLSGIPSPLTLNSTSEEIRQRILLSHTFWQALWADAQITDYVSGTPAVQRVQVWLNQPAQARVLSGKADGTPATLWISDGQMTRTGKDLSGYGLENFMPPMTESDTVYPHPMTGIMPTPLSSLLFPSGLAQRGGTYRPIAMETVAGRETLIVEWNRPDGPLTDRFWVDTVTGIILHQQNYGKGGDGALTYEYLITNIQYDLTFQPETFNRLAAFPPAFASGPEDIFTEVATPVSEGEPDTSLASGEIYMALNTFDGYGVESIARFPASCLISGELCPQPEVLAGVPVGLQLPFVWSPDYQQAVFSVSDMEDQVWRFDRALQTWILLDIPFMSGLSWAPDGQWIVGNPMISGSPASNPLIVANMNGSEWSEIMADLPYNKSAIAWLNDDRILVENILDNEVSDEDGMVAYEIQTYNMSSGETQTITNITYDANTSNLDVSAERTQLIYAITNRMTNISTLTWIDLEENLQSNFEVPWFVAELSWSPHGDWLAISTYLGNSCELYLVHPDGSELHQVFTGEWGGGCSGVWSPDGQTLLVPALAQTPTIPRLYVINVATGESRLVELPDVGVEFEWSVVSWVP